MAALAELIDWAEHNTISTIWSCLAAHAAVLHLDGIGRRPLADKRFGVFECTRVADHPLMAGAGRVCRCRIRAGTSSLEALWRHAATTSPHALGDAGVDTFVKQGKSLFVFFQGHPEYDARALLREYRRDVGRFLRGERETYPAMPHGYFDQRTARCSGGLSARARLRTGARRCWRNFPMAAAGRRVWNLRTTRQPRAFMETGCRICRRKRRKAPSRRGRVLGPRRQRADRHWRRECALIRVGLIHMLMRAKSREGSKGYRRA